MIERGELYADKTCHPGGLALTKRALEVCRLPDGARIVDVGCGRGAAVRYLNASGGLRAYGVDRDPGAHPPDGVLLGDASALPFPNGFFEAALFECSLSKMEDRQAALREARRVLRTGGKLIVSDLYAKGEGASFHGLLGHVRAWESIYAELQQAGFLPGVFEDHTEQLTALYAQLLFEHGMDGLIQLLGGTKEQLKAARCGYFLAVWEKKRGEAPLDLWVRRRLQAAPTEALAQGRERAAWASIQRAKEKSPFYARHLDAFPPEFVQQPDWLAKLPFTCAEDIALHGREMLCVPANGIARIRSFPTSGSTSPAKRIWFTESDLKRTEDFFAVGMRPLVASGGLVAVMMSDDRAGSVADLLKKGVARFGARARICGQVHDAEAAAAAAEGADCLVGLPAELLYLCRKAPHLRPKTVLLSADYLPPGLPGVLEAGWGCRVFCHYGLTETCYGLAVQCCEQEGQHLRAADFIVEIVDPESGAVLPAGAVGEVVLTSLRSEALPLIRYRTGDVSSLLPGPCGCGSVMPRLGPVLGRRARLARAVNIHRLDDILLPWPGVFAYCAAWRGNVLHLRIEGGPVDAEALREALSCRVEVEYGAVPPDGRGKRAIGLSSWRAEKGEDGLWQNGKSG